jgi:nucleoside-diphosphate-sugar epimerase
MNVFIAGGSGTIGVPLVRAVVAAGHTVTAMTRSPKKEEELGALGASVAIADALDRRAVARALADAHPTHVIHQLTALPKGGVRRSTDLESTNRLRIDGTRYLLEAAVDVGARRFLVGSFAMASLARGTMSADALAALRSMEIQVLDATARGAIEGVILRYGLFYGPAVPSTMTIVDTVRRHLPVIDDEAGRLAMVTVDDAVSATVLALDGAPSGAVYDIVDDRPVTVAEVVKTIEEYTGSSAPQRRPASILQMLTSYMTRLSSRRQSMSNAKAKTELGWRPVYPTIREGLAPFAQQAA